MWNYSKHDITYSIHIGILTFLKIQECNQQKFVYHTDNTQFLIMTKMIKSMQGKTEHKHELWKVYTLF